MPGLDETLYPVVMVAYAVTARIDHARPHRPESDRSTDLWLDQAADGRPVAVVEDLTGASVEARISDWWSSVVSNWSQTTFFLFDPESWR